ncbi:ATP-NAD kinase-like domain-containing protein [Fimicolochytrium jonesii]|uniref:ATP-NAD kinase-like domain-containing protein n=1 Tax=Fimicolochytrium jonesii TaxID=1396493 RepID=UPI0022FE8065|nr:ATP-NAD kinase-like domain-containing protein [Fimicolochytrium jonesii]KAI8817576.1 ATP-NAD kinase-like domain-containing protein [Fimicolochytrium jonesii]
MCPFWPESTFHVTLVIHRAIRYAGTKPVLLLVNPFGGTKRGVKNYEQYVRPMLHLSETPFELRKTTHQQHATQIAQEIDIDAYSAIVTISGDGVFHEVVHGLLSRRDWEQASKLPIGLIGSGTANALGKNLMCGSIELATLAVIKLRTRPMDAFSITQNDTVTYSHLQLMWTLLADVDFESEAYRWLGAERMTVAAVIRLIRMRTYHGKLYLLPSDKAHGAGPSRSSSPTPKGNSPSSPATYGPQRIYTADPKAHLSWPTIIDSSFNYFVATNLPWISDDFIVTPHARIADGDIHVVWSEKMSFRDALRPLLDQGTGAYIAQPSVKAERVKALVLEPQGWTWDKERKAGSKMHEGEFMDVSGERVPYVTTKMEIHPGVLNVLCPDWLDESAWTRAYEKATRGS